MSGTAAASRRRSADRLSLVFATGSTGVAADVALLIVRGALAWIFVYYGAAKLFGAFPSAGPNGIHQTAQFMARTAHLHPGEFFAVLAGVTEFGGGVAIALGLATRLAGLALFGDMVVATVTVTWSTGLNSTTSPPGYQLNVAMGALAIVATLAGAGRFSADALIVRSLGRGREAPATTLSRQPSSC